MALGCQLRRFTLHEQLLRQLCGRPCLPQRVEKQTKSKSSAGLVPTGRAAWCCVAVLLSAAFPGTGQTSPSHQLHPYPSCSTCWAGVGRSASASHPFCPETIAEKPQGEKLPVILPKREEQQVSLLKKGFLWLLRRGQLALDVSSSVWQRSLGSLEFLMVMVIWSFGWGDYKVGVQASCFLL